MTRHAYICDAVRTPFGHYGGALASVRTDDLGAGPLAAQKAGYFDAEIVPVRVPQKKGEALLVNRDEHPRDTTLEALARLNGVVRARRHRDRRRRARCWN